MEATREDAAEYYRRAKMKPETAVAVAAFFDEEAKLFDDSIKPVVKAYPRFQNKLSDFYQAICLPNYRASILIRELLPAYMAALEDRRQQLSSVVNDKSLEMTPSDALLIEGAKQIIKNYIELLDGSEEKIRSFVQFNKRVFEGIRDHPGSSEQAAEDIHFRNAVYRAALGKEHWLLGYNLRLTAGLSEVISRENSWIFENYYPVKRKEGFKPGKKVAFLSDSGLGIIDSSEFYKKVLPELVKNETVESSSALRKAVDAHFNKRLSDILAE